MAYMLKQCAETLCVHTYSHMFTPQCAEPLMLGYSIDASEEIRHLRGPLLHLMEELPGPEVGVDKLEELLVITMDINTVAHR